MFLRDKLRGGVQIPLAPRELGLQVGGSCRMDVLCQAVPVEWGASFWFYEFIKNKEKNTEGACMTSFQRVLLLVGAVAGVCGDRRLLQSATVSDLGLGWSHLAGLRLGGSGRGVVISQWILAAAERSEHAVPELEDKRRQPVRTGPPTCLASASPPAGPLTKSGFLGDLATCMLPFNQRCQEHSTRGFVK